MKSLIYAGCLVLLTLVSTPTALADVTKPKQPEKQVAKYVLHSSLEISTDPKAYEAKLQISQSELKSLQAALASAGGDTTIAASIAQSPARTIVAGLLMFLAVSVAGVLFARSSSFGRRQKTVAGMILLLAMVGAAAIITRGNAGPPGSYRWRNLTQALAEGKPTSGGIDIEIIPDDPNPGARMRLILPLKKQGANGEE
jgi:hypothetical protein